ncbi:MAG TPA: RagB/SusD family nutrient uptake outer membrane protein [Balneolaceae bacterium]
MKKLKLIKYIAVIAILFTGCDDLLNKPEPATSVSGEVVLTSENGVNALRASIYSKLRASFDYTTEYFVGPSAMADETRNRPGSSRFQGLTSANSSDGGTDGLSSYGSTYNILLDANLMIGAVEADVLPQETLDRYRGEAYAIRAFVMHHLVRSLGYEPGMAVDGFDLGIPIITSPTLDISDVQPTPRATVSAIYEQILSDLAQAKTLLEGYNSDNTYITEAFVDGLTARVNLYAGNWAAADAAATEAIANANSGGIVLVTDSATVADMFDETGPDHPEALFELEVNPDTEPIAGSAVNNGLAAYTATYWIAQVPTNFVIDLYNAADNRLGWYGPCFDNSAGAPEDGCTDVNDEGWEIQKWNAEKGNATDDIPYMRIAEMYLIQAEARAKANNSVAAGIGPLNTLRQARGLGPVAAVDFATLTAFEDEILNERVRELAVEGHRFWDLKRLGRNIPNPDGTTKIRYDSYRILDNFGAGLLSANPELVENPGY